MNKTALVTGGSHNIGQGIAITLAKHGYDVSITYNTRKEGALETKRQIEELGQKCWIYQATLDREDIPQKTVDQAHKDMGHIDLLVCNAANGGVRGSILTITPDYLNHIITLNFRNYILCAAAASRHMVADKIAGNVIFITSTHGERAYPNDFLYGSLKAAVERAAESMALDLASYGIRVNCIAPGAIWQLRPDAPPPAFVTECIPLQRVGTPAEIGELAVFLASDAGSYITGMTIRQDGGLILPGMMELRDPPPVWLPKEWHEQEYQTAMKMLEEQSNATEHEFR